MPNDKPTCANCRFWQREWTDNHKLSIFGKCQRRAPAHSYTDRCTWPETEDTNWCGEHQPAEGQDAEARHTCCQCDQPATVLMPMGPGGRMYCDDHRPDWEWKRRDAKYIAGDPEQYPLPCDSCQRHVPTMVITDHPDSHDGRYCFTCLAEHDA